MPLYERRGEDRFDEAVAMFRGVPGARLEPGPRSVADSVEKVEAILYNPAIYELASAIPGPARTGRPRDYPAFMILVFNSLLSVDV